MASHPGHRGNPIHQAVPTFLRALLGLARRAALHPASPLAVQAAVARDLLLILHAVNRHAPIRDARARDAVAVRRHQSSR